MNPELAAAAEKAAYERGRREARAECEKTKAELVRELERWRKLANEAVKSLTTE